MKVQCVQCKEIVDIGDFRSSEQGIEITCVACGETYAVSSSRGGGATPAASAPMPEGNECPKCGAANAEDAAACMRCGLAAERFEGFEREHGESIPEALVELWQAARDSWQDPEAHDRFVRAAVAAEAYRFAARSYREVLREQPNDAIAERQLGEIQRRAEVAILQTAAARRYEPETREPFKGVAIMLVLLVALAAIGTVYAFFLRDNAEESATRSRPAKVETPPTATTKKQGTPQ